MSCDEAVLAQFGNQIKKGYSASLLAFAMERHPYSFAPVAFGEADAGRRIKNVLNFKKTTYLGGCDCNRFGCTCGSKLSDKPETVGDKNRAYNRESG